MFDGVVFRECEQLICIVDESEQGAVGMRYFRRADKRSAAEQFFTIAGGAKPAREMGDGGQGRQEQFFDRSGLKVFDGMRALESEIANGSADESAHQAATAQSLAQIAGDRADICSGPAFDLELDFGKAIIDELDAVH